jgi:hypothetical protein
MHLLKKEIRSQYRGSLSTGNIQREALEKTCSPQIYASICIIGDTALSETQTATHPALKLEFRIT